jgi:NAD(P)-dependent dehydrogenase (short-subunit alcohol dehydrogenase family)
MALLEGKVALVTGGSYGIGLATAKAFAEEGAVVYITGRDEGRLNVAVKRVGTKAHAIKADSSKITDLDRVAQTISGGGHRLDVLFANAGGGDVTTPLVTATEEHFDSTFDLNVKGTFFTVQKMLPLLNDNSSVILNASAFNMKGIPGASTYCASKAAIRSFARTWANELKDRKIRVNSLSPGSTLDTGTLEGVSDEIKQYVVGMIPLGRMGLSKEIASAALFLASEQSAFMTGSDLVIDGGMSQV